MATNTVSIDVVANDLASAALDLVKNKLMGIGGTAAIVGTAALTMGAAIVTGLNKAKDAAQAYDQQVKELMLRTGGTAEETSRLIQAVDDAGISYETLTSAMRFAVKNGIDPNITGLAKLSDEYKSINDPIAQGQFLLDKFGRSGMDMARAMDLGGAALLRMASGTSKNLVTTEEAIKQSEEYRKNLDELTDTVDGYWISIGNKVIPAMNDWVSAWKTLSRETENNNQVMQEAQRITNTSWQQFQHLSAAQRDAAQAQARLNISIQNGNSDATLLMSTNSMLSGSFENTASAAAQEAQALQEASAQFTSMINLTQQLEGATAQAANSISYGMLMAKLSVDGLTQAEYELGQQAGVAMGIFSQKTADTAAKINYMTDMVIKGKLNVELLRSAIESLRDRDISINVAIQGAYASQFQSNQQANAASNPDHTYNTPGRATGGSVMAGRPYMVGEAGRELFVPSQNGNIVPNDKLGSGGGTVINLTYAPAFSAATRDEMQNILLPFIIEGIRQANLR